MLAYYYTLPPFFIPNFAFPSLYIYILRLWLMESTGGWAVTALDRPEEKKKKRERTRLFLHNTAYSNGKLVNMFSPRFLPLSLTLLLPHLPQLFSLL